MAPHSSTLAWKLPWTDEPGGLQSMGPQAGVRGRQRAGRVRWHVSGPRVKEPGGRAQRGVVGYLQEIRGRRGARLADTATGGG